MKLIKEILIGAAALAAFSSTLAFAGDNIVLNPNGHGSYSLISRIPDDSPMIGLSVNGSGGSNSLGNSATAAVVAINTGDPSLCADHAHGSSAVYSEAGVTLRDNAHGAQMPR